MERKLSKFAVGDKFTTRTRIIEWACGGDTEPQTYTVSMIIEDKDGFVYRAASGSTIHEKETLIPLEAKNAALSWLLERAKIIANHGEEQPCNDAT